MTKSEFSGRLALKIIIAKLILIIIISIGVFYQINREIKYLVADHYFRELKIALADKDYFKAYVLYEYIEVRNDYYDRHFGRALTDNFNNFKALAVIKVGEGILKQIVENLEVDNFDNIFAKAKIYTALAQESEGEYYELAEENFRKAINLSPQMPKNYRELAKMQAKKGEFGLAEKNYGQALKMLPDINNPYMNDKHRRVVNFEKYLIYKDLADIYLVEREYKRAKEYYWLAFNNNLADITLYKKIADVYYQQGDLNKAIWYNKRGMRLNLDDYAWPFAIALLYEESGDEIKALEYAEQALSLAPENKEIKDFIKNLQ